MKKELESRKDEADKNSKDLRKRLLDELKKTFDSDSLIVKSKDNGKRKNTSKSRSSRFRGVSKNGSKWQVFIVLSFNR
jgi:hypothetical protein